MLLFDYLFTFDLKSAYYHVDIAKSTLGLHGMDIFTVLPFGLSSACYNYVHQITPSSRALLAG